MFSRSIVIVLVELASTKKTSENLGMEKNKPQHKVQHKNGLPLCSSIRLTFSNELECNLALACTTKSIQNKHMSLSQVLGEVFVHLRQYVMSSNEDRGGRRAVPENLLNFGRRLDFTTWM
jgi:hypothetical protein